VGAEPPANVESALEKFGPNAGKSLSCLRKACFVRAAFEGAVFGGIPFGEAPFEGAVFGGIPFGEAPFEGAVFDEASFGGEAFNPGFLFLAAIGPGLGGGIFTPALEGGTFVTGCFLEAGFAAASFAGFCFVEETEAPIFFFKLWPEEMFFLPPAFEGLTLRGGGFRVLFCFEEADLAAGFTFLLATLSPSSMKTDIWSCNSDFIPRNGRKEGCQSKPSSAPSFFALTFLPSLPKSGIKIKYSLPIRRNILKPPKMDGGWHINGFVAMKERL
jgi:hypothetical protein